MKNIFSKLFYKDTIFKIPVDLEIDIQLKEKINNILNKLDIIRKKYLAILDRKILVFFVIVLGLILFNILIRPTLAYNNIVENFYQLLVNYNFWWNKLPKIISFFLPSKLIWFKPNFIIFSFLLILSTFFYTLLPIFQYRNIEHSYEAKLFDLIMREYIGNDIDNENDLSENDFYNYLQLPSYDNMKFSTHNLVGKYNNYNWEIAEVNFLLNDPLSAYRPQSLTLSSLIIKIDLPKKFPNFFIEIGEKLMRENSWNLVRNYDNVNFYSDNNNLTNEQISNIANFFTAYRNTINLYDHKDKRIFFDDIIANFLKKQGKYNAQHFSHILQSYVIDDKAFILISLDRNIMRQKSLFTCPIINQDIILLIYTAQMIKQFINFLENL